MKPSDVVSYAFSAIKLRKLRASLTTLGVVIGIAAIVALLSLGQGFQKAITVQFEKGFATNTLIVSTQGLAGRESSFQLLVNDSLNINKIESVAMTVPVIQKTCYINVSKGTFLVNVQGIDFAKYSSIYGDTFVAQTGNIPLNPDNQSIVIGARVHDPSQNGTIIASTNDTVQIIYTTVTSDFKRENISYTGHVSAVLDEIGGFGLGGPSDLSVYIPISQAQSFFGTEQVSTIIVQLKNSDETTIKDVSDAIRSSLGDQVSVISSTAVLNTISTVFSFIEIFLAGIAGISLLVAGIGIMNIMIVSLMERTREIGILKALGMKGRTVLSIFLSESIIIGLLGATIGIAVGLTLAEIVARVGFQFIGRPQGAGVAQNMGGLMITPILTPTVFLGAFAFGLIVSVIFALYPAWRASKLKPVDALRYE